MHIIDLREQIKAQLTAFLATKVTKQYPAGFIDDDNTRQYFSDIAKKADKATGWVYVIFDENRKQSKIGYTCCNPVDRARRIFPSSDKGPMLIAAFLTTKHRPWDIENFVQRILYAGGFQSEKQAIGDRQAYSGGTEIFDIKPAVACALIDDAINTVRFSE